YDGEVRVWDLKTGEAKASIRPDKGYGVSSAFLSPDGSRLVTQERTGYQAGEQPPLERVRLYDVSTGKSWPLGEGMATAVFTSDGSRAYVVLTEYTATKLGSSLKAVDKQGQELATVGTLEDKGYTSPQLSADGKRLAVTTGGKGFDEAGTVEVFDTKTNKVVASFDTAGKYPFLNLAFSPDGVLLAATDYKGGVTVWDVT